MVEYPVSFSSSSEASSGEQEWKSRMNSEELKLSTPPEFGGKESLPSPEVLYLSAIENCLLATFKTIAERKDLQFTGIETSSEAVLERDDDSRPLVAEAEIQITVKGVEAAGKAEKVREATMKNCFIHKSVKTEIREEFVWK